MIKQGEQMKKVIVIVEDEKDLNELVKRYLEKEGYEGGEADSYISEALKFKGSVAALINRIENKVKVDEFKLKHNFPMENEDGSPEQVYDIYEDVIGEHNRLNRK